MENATKVEVPKRTLQVVQQEYQTLCTRAGHAEYNRSVLAEEIRRMQKEMRALNKEAARLSAKEQPAAEPTEVTEAPSEQTGS